MLSHWRRAVHDAYSVRKKVTALMTACTNIDLICGEEFMMDKAKVLSLDFV